MTDIGNKLQILSEQINERKKHVKNEETTKQVLIIPFIQLLGYDVFNPLEVRPEYISDFAKKKGEKVDYAVFHNNEPVIFIEAKSINESLEKHSAQLSRYFNATHLLKLAILTNGIEYLFFTDTNVINVMDEAPFLSLNITNPDEDSIKFLEQICKENYSFKAVQQLAEELVYSKDLDYTLNNLLNNPTDDFIRFIVKDIVPTRITATVIEKFRPLVAKSISNAVNSYYELNTKCLEEPKDTHTNEITPKKSNGKRSSARITTPAIKDEPTSDNIKVNTYTSISETLEVEANEYTLAVYERLLKIINTENIDTTKISFKSYSNEFVVYLGDISNWIVRLSFGNCSGTITIPYDTTFVSSRIGNLLNYEESSIPASTNFLIDTLDDIYKLSKLITKKYKEITD